MVVPMVQATVAPVPAPVPDDVVVVGERLKRWTGRITANPLATRCRTTVSTGDREIDAVGCAALTACWSEYRQPIAAVRDDRRLDAAARWQRQEPIERAFGGCLTARRDALVAALVERRHAAPEAAR